MIFIPVLNDPRADATHPRRWRRREGVGPARGPDCRFSGDPVRSAHPGRAM